jgi:5-methylcytosine-specific restriction endonuclease McrA
MAWTSSDRRQRLPANWPALVAETKRIAKGRCQALAHVTGCDGIGTDCDHIEQGDDHSQTNLQWLSRACHKAKTMSDNGYQPRLTRTPERHPGAL